MKRYGILYLTTFLVLIPLDFLFLGTIAKSFFQSQVGDMLGEVRLAPAILFYLLYIVGVLIFTNGSSQATWQSALLYGAGYSMLHTLLNAKLLETVANTAF